jgi:hypothetical protein
VASLTSHPYSAGQEEEEEEEEAEEALLSSCGEAPSTSTRTATAYDEHEGGVHASGELSRQVLHPTVRSARKSPFWSVACRGGWRSCLWR